MRNRRFAPKSLVCACAAAFQNNCYCVESSATEDLSILNLLLHAGSSLGETLNVSPNWSEFMQSVCHRRHSGALSVQMLSFLDFKPSDKDCISSTLLFVQKCFNTETPNIASDQPLCVKAVKIAMEARLDIVVCLGVFHTLMSFLGSVGHLTRGHGLHETVRETWLSTLTESATVHTALSKVTGAEKAVFQHVEVYACRNRDMAEKPGLWSKNICRDEIYTIPSDFQTRTNCVACHRVSLFLPNAHWWPVDFSKVV